MSKLAYMLTMLLMVSGLSAYAETECPEGQIYDAEQGICVDQPEELPVE